jgi:hypothetical protein
MRPLQILQVGAILAFSLTACNSKTTYNFPTDTTPLRLRTPAEEDYQVFYNSYGAFAKQNANELATQKEDFLFPVLSTYQSGLSILASAEGKSYQKAAKFLRTDAPDEYPLIQCFNPMLIDLKKRENLKVGSSLWMIWPIPLQKPFVAEIAEKTGTDIIYLGSVGLTARRAMDRWLVKFQPEIKIENPGYERYESIISLGVTALHQNFAVTKTETADLKEAWVAKNDDFTFVAWIATPTDFFPSAKVLHLLLDAHSKSSTNTPEEFKFTDETNITESLKALDCNQLLRGPNDFRNLSVEIIPEGDRIGIPYLRQHAEINLSITGDNPFNQKLPIGYAVLDTKTELPLLIGKHTPK